MYTLLFLQTSLWRPQLRGDRDEDRTVSRSTIPVVDLAPRSSDGWRSLDLKRIPGFSTCVWDSFAPILAMNAGIHSAGLISLQSCNELHISFHVSTHSSLSSAQGDFLRCFLLYFFSPPLHTSSMCIGSSGSLLHAPYLFSHNYCFFIFFSLSSQRIP